MNDDRMIAQYFARDEEAIAETARQYGKLCHSVAMNILDSEEDAEECVNDTYLRAWESIPPERPMHLGAYLCQITRHLALGRLRDARRKKRGGGQLDAALDELHECVADLRDAAETSSDNMVLRQALNSFLRALPIRTRRVFLSRYWFARSVAEIAAEYGMSENHVKVMLHRTREKLRAQLGKDGIEI